MNIDTDNLKIEDVYSNNLGRRVTVVYDHNGKSRGVYPLRVEYVEGVLNDGEKVELLVAENGLLVKTKAKSSIIATSEYSTGGVSFYGLEDLLNKLIVTRNQRQIPYDDGLFNEDTVQELRSAALQMNVAAQGGDED